MWGAAEWPSVSWSARQRRFCSRSPCSSSASCTGGTGAGLSAGSALARPGAFGDGSDITEQAVASYVAKYATKAAENTGTLDRCIGELAELDRHQVPDHARRLLQACRDLDDLYPDRRLWAWAHMLGFRGHFATKSRRYSITLGTLRQERADYRAAQEHADLGLEDIEPDTVLVLADWQYAGHGHTPANPRLPRRSHGTSSSTAKPHVKPCTTNWPWKEPQHEGPIPQRRPGGRDARHLSALSGA